MMFPVPVDVISTSDKLFFVSEQPIKVWSSSLAGNWFPKMILLLRIVPAAHPMIPMKLYLTELPTIVL